VAFALAAGAAPVKTGAAPEDVSGVITVEIPGPAIEGTGSIASSPLLVEVEPPVADPETPPDRALIVGNLECAERIPEQIKPSGTLEEVGPTETARLAEDLRLMSAGIGKATTVLVEFDVPLSRSMSLVLFELSQKLELSMTLRLPPLAGAQQVPLRNDFMQSSGRFFRVELRSESG
jgi:hypothetical protein